MNNESLKAIYCDLVKARNQINITISELEADNSRLERENIHLSNNIDNTTSAIIRYIAESKLRSNIEQSIRNNHNIDRLKKTLYHLQ